MRKIQTILVFAVLFLAQPATAQIANLQVAPRIGYDIAGDVEEAFVGGEVRFGLGELPVLLNGVFDYYFAEDPLTFFQISANALYYFGIDNEMFTPYAGAGLSINRISVDIDTGGFGAVDASSNEIGVNLIGGAVLEMPGLRPFAQLQYTTSDFDLGTITVGVLFGI